MEPLRRVSLRYHTFRNLKLRRIQGWPALSPPLIVQLVVRDGNGRLIAAEWVLSPQMKGVLHDVDHVAETRDAVTPTSPADSFI